MSHMVWRFEYSVQERVDALKDILVQQERVLPSHIKREWFYRAQFVLEPAGWFALWRLPRDTCQQMGVRFPCVVYVMVEDLIMSEEDLSACVRVIGVQDDSIHLPERSVVPLQQLWATLAQRDNVIEVRPTAKFIDLYRYFYTLIWMPWDLEEDEHDNGRCWFQQNVPARCQLWATAFEGKGFKSDMLYALRDDGEILRQHILRIEEGISSDNEDDLDSNVDSVSTLVSLHERLQGLRARWELLQNPSLQCLWDNDKSTASAQSEITLIWKGGPVKEYMNCLNAANEWMKSKKIDSNKNVGCSPSLIAALNPKPKPFSILLLCEGVHHLPRFLSIGDGYKISSVYPGNNSSTVLKSTENSTTAISIYESLELSSVTIDTTLCSTGLAVRAGCLTLNSCLITAPTNSSSQAAVIFENGEVVFRDCTVSGFYTGIIAHCGSKVKFVDCTFKKCGVMLQMYEGAKVLLKRCKFLDAGESAIRYESLQVTNTTVGGVGVLNKYPDIKIEDCSFANKNKNDVCIAHLDEFACPELEGEIATI